MIGIKILSHISYGPTSVWIQFARDKTWKMSCPVKYFIEFVENIIAKQYLDTVLVQCRLSVAVIILFVVRPDEIRKKKNIFYVCSTNFLRLQNRSVLNNNYLIYRFLSRATERIIYGPANTNVRQLMLIPWYFWNHFFF